MISSGKAANYTGQRAQTADCATSALRPATPCAPIQRVTLAGILEGQNDNINNLADLAQFVRSIRLRLCGPWPEEASKEPASGPGNPVEAGNFQNHIVRNLTEEIRGHLMALSEAIG